MTADDIIKELKKDSNLNVSVFGDRGLPVLGVSNDSRKIKPGYLFAARKGVNINSNDYIKDAIIKGASIILTDDDDFDERFEDWKKSATVIKVNDALKAYAIICGAFFGNPGDKLTLIGITGTNGKTTTTFLVKSILADFGFNSGLIGTIDYEIGNKKSINSNNNTTPDAFELNKMLHDMNSLDIKYCAMEISSHSLVQDRVYGLPLDAAVFTNLTRDHLDYHKDMDDYFEAKRKLFLEVLFKSNKPKKFAIINNDDAYGKNLINELNKLKLDLKLNFNILTYGLNAGSDVFAENISYLKDGLKFTVMLPDSKKLEISSNLIGSYNVYNILAAVSVAFALSIPEKFIESGVKNLNNVPGRVEKISIKNVKTPLVCVDYAHTDDALERVLTALRDISEGRLICVFGCGGDRDKGKRPLMGKHSSNIADITIITSDNPRSEEPLSIIGDIEKGIEKAEFIDFTGISSEELKIRLQSANGHIYGIIESRAEAIKAALNISEHPDTVLIAGKGHEDYMIVKNERFHFSDKEEVLKFYENCI